MAAPPKDKNAVVPPDEVQHRLTRYPWHCTKIKDYANHSTWRSQFGWHFSVPHDCTEEDFEDIMSDLRKNGRKRNL